MGMKIRNRLMHLPTLKTILTPWVERGLRDWELEVAQVALG